MNEWLGSLGELLTGAAAVYAAISGIASYRRSVEAQGIESLMEIESQFRLVFPTFAIIDDDTAYRHRVEPVLLKDAASQELTSDEQSLLRDIDLCFRFFYLLWIRKRLAASEKDLSAVYGYYLNLIRKRLVLKKYADEYYPIIWEIGLSYETGDELLESDAGSRDEGIAHAKN